MPHETPLIATIVVGLVLAFVFGALANRLKISPLVGYLLAGIAVGPQTPGFVADASLAQELAEIGVILLMFGVGLHFSLKELLSVRAIAIPGAVGQILIATLMGMGLAAAMGWDLGAGIVFGLALSVASTVVLLRALQEQRLISTPQGHIAVGWLIVEDLAMVLALVLLPPFAGLLNSGTDGAAEVGASDIVMTIGLTLLKVAAFIAIMLVAGRRVIPWILHRIAHTGSRELFRLGVLAIALGTAYGAAVLFDVSFALGAFFAGMMMNESELSAQAAHETLPLRDAFAVLFFVAVGMLFNPMILIEQALPLTATVLIIVVGKSVVALGIVLAFKRPMDTALTISASLAQIGEFSFILATLGVSLGLLPTEGRDLILGGAIISILLNPFIFGAIARVGPRLQAAFPDSAATTAAAAAAATPAPAAHAVVVGYGRVGSVIGEGLRERGQPFVVIEENQDIIESLEAEGVSVVPGPRRPVDLMAQARIKEATSVFVALPISFEAGQYVEVARAANPEIFIVARAHSDAEVDYLQRMGANVTIMGEREIGRAMVEHALTQRTYARPA